MGRHVSLSIVGFQALIAVAEELQRERVYLLPATAALPCRPPQHRLACIALCGVADFETGVKQVLLLKDPLRPRPFTGEAVFAPQWYCTSAEVTEKSTDDGSDSVPSSVGKVKCTDVPSESREFESVRVVGRIPTSLRLVVRLLRVHILENPENLLFPKKNSVRRGVESQVTGSLRDGRV